MTRPSQARDRDPALARRGGVAERHVDRFGVLDVNAARQERARLQSQLRDLLDRVEDAGRDLTDDQQRTFDDMMSEVDGLTRLIDDEDARRERDRGAVETAAGGAGRGPLFTLADGSQVRGRLHGQPLAAPSGDYSVGRAVVAAVTGRWDLAEREQRDQMISSDPSGGYFLAPELSGMLLDQARAQAVLSRAGAVTVPLSGPETRIVRVEQDPQAAWHQELASIASTDIKLGQVTLYPQALAGMVTLSEELAEDAANGVQTVENVLSAAVANQLDRALFVGMPERSVFTGVVDDMDASVVDAAGAAPSDYSLWLDAIEQVQTANGPAAIDIVHPRTARQLNGLTASDGQPLRQPPGVEDLRRLPSTQVPTNLGGTGDNTVAVVGDFTLAGASVILGVRSAFRLEATREGGDAFETLARKIRIWGRFDLAIGRPSLLARIENIGP